MTTSIWSGFWGPFFTLIGALVVALLANFLAEDFRRFRDGTALASALLGELLSYKDAFKQSREGFNHYLEEAKKGNVMVLPNVDVLPDRVYESHVSKIGLLGSDLPQKVVMTYGRITIYKVALNVLTSAKYGTDDETLISGYSEMLYLIDKIEEVDSDAISALTERAHLKFLSHLNQVRKTIFH